MNDEFDAVRPVLGPLAGAAAGAWGGVNVAEAASWNDYVGTCFSWMRVARSPIFVATLMIAAAFLSVLVVRHPLLRNKLSLVLKALLPTALGFGCALCCGMLYWNAWVQDVKACEAACEDGEVVMQLTSDPVARDYGTVSEATVQGTRHKIRLRLLWPDGANAPLAGHCVKVSGVLGALEDDGGGRWNHRQGFVGMVQANACSNAGCASNLQGLMAPFRDSCAARLSALKGDAPGLLAGVLIGDRQYYSGTELEQDFKTTGLAHLMAVSGTHLAVAAGLALWLLRKLRLRRGMRNVALAVLLIGYVALTGFAASALRALVMNILALAGALSMRRKNPLTALFACIVAFLCMRPFLAFSVGYQLSVLAVLGITCFTPLAKAWLECLLPKRFRGLAEPASASLCATAPTLPVTVPLFYQLPLISPLATFLAAPFITACLTLGIPALLMKGPLLVVGNALLKIAGTVANTCAWLVGHLADVPLACLSLDASASWLTWACALALVVLWAVWPLPKTDHVERGAVAYKASKALSLAVLIAPLILVLFLEHGGIDGMSTLVTGIQSSKANIVMLDVGQGDSMLIRDGDAAVLIDTGEDSNVLLADLASVGVTDLDAVILTHKDSDHAGALKGLTGVIPVGHVYIHKDLLAYSGESQVLKAAKWATSGKGAEGLSVGDCIRVGRFSITMMAPMEGGESENEDSLVNLIAYDDDGDGTPEVRGLVSGDAESDALQGVLNRVGDVSFVKVPHHGSNAAFTSQDLSMLKPEVALISVGSNNEYGHPTQSTLQTLKAAGCHIYRTDLQGAITLIFSAGGLSVRTG